MPATEQTYYSTKVMHIVFGASAVVMMVATLWMLAKDHNREWKKWQMEDRKKEAWMLRSQHDSLEANLEQERAKSSDRFRLLQTEPVDPQVVSKFKSLVEKNPAREAGDAESDEVDFSQLDEAVERHNRAATALAEARIAAGGENNGSEDSAADKTANLKPLVESALDSRSILAGAFEKFVDDAERSRDLLVAQKKFFAADRTAAVSELGLKIGGSAPEDQVAEVQARVDELDGEIDQLVTKIADAASYLRGLESVVREMNSEQTEINKTLTAMHAKLSMLEDQAYKSTSSVFSNPVEWLTRLPVLNALYDGDVRIDQIWLPEMKINFNFSQVARFDRCKTCHRSISQTAPGTADTPAYPTLPETLRSKQVALTAPDEKPAEDATLTQVYGLVLAEEGVLDYSDVTVYFVLPESPAALAGLQAGDVIRFVGDRPIYERESVANYLLREADAGEVLSLSIERGFDHPFTSHPRLDLYLTDGSPHPEKDFGCTICHDGQGSGTDFKWASHTPNNASQQGDWTREHGWFDNHHWIFPMQPSRFAESNCLKCHHEKGSLAASERFPKPPAAKLVEGWTLVEQFGCFGCHETNGFDGPDKRIGPDVRVEPNYYGVAAQILSDDQLTDQQRNWATTLVSRPDDSTVRRLLMADLKQDAKLAQNEATRSEARLSAATHKLAAGLKDVDAPGSYRRAGPSLRFLKSKVDAQWLYNWIEVPSSFRPTTRMPQFFGLHEHLQEAGDAEELAVSQRFESIEVRALTQFLLDISNDFEYLSPPEEVTETPSAERGKWLFESRGCLACHSHQDFPGIASDQGPDLSRVSAKFNSNKGALWLYSWIRQPHRYHVRTRMPELFLTPIEEKGADGKPTGEITDPAADIAAFLLSVPTDWQPTRAFPDEMSAEEQATLAELAAVWLTSDAIPAQRATQLVQEGIPQSMASQVKVDERVLVGINDANRVDKQLEYVARRTISKYGCFGCHDIPGFELAKPIGTALAEWGRKETSKLAFENIHKFLETPQGLSSLTGEPPTEAHGDEHAGHGHLDPADFDEDTGYFVQSINSHSRNGFIWQKLRLPRSFDYKTTKNKGYNERLRMPKFPLTGEQREAIITFVLGLVNEAPAEQFVYHPDPRQQAIVEGRQVLDKFNCAGCHTLRMEQWQVAFSEEELESPTEIADFPFLDVHFGVKQKAASRKTDSRGLVHVTLEGLPAINQETGLPNRLDEDGLPIEPDDDESEPYYQFRLWKDALIAGEPWLVGVQDLMIPASADGYGPARGEAWPAWGGDLSRYLFPRVIERAKVANPQVKGSEAWGWLPPQLLDEGEKVQTDWLHGFLMDPTTIRPAVVMRMPNFHMSSVDAAKLVDYFAATSDAQFPYEYKPQQRASYLAEQEADRPERMQEAMGIVVDGNYCVKCHAVGDFEPQGDPTTFGPNLADVHRRLRPEYVRDWVANPRRLLPYTGMPTNIPYKPDAPHLGGISQELFPGTSLDQLSGLIDLIMNFDLYARRQTSIAPLVKSPAPGGEEASP